MDELNIDLTGIALEVFTELYEELKNEPDFNETILANKIKNAIREIKLRRCYQYSKYTDADIENDLNNYYSVIKDVALYDYNKIGSEGQSSHSEDGTSRHYVDRNKLFGDVVAFVRFL